MNSQEIIEIENENYIKAYNYEYGVGQLRNYKLARIYYDKAAKDGIEIAKKKLKTYHISIVNVIIMLAIVCFTVLSYVNNYPWYIAFFFGVLGLVSSLLYYNRYWNKKGYASILNVVFGSLSLFLLIPGSTIKPYITGESFYPITVMFAFVFFIMAASLIFFLIERKQQLLFPFISSLFIFVMMIIVFSFPSPGKIYSFSIIDGKYAEITGYRSSEVKVIIPEKINGYEVISIGSDAFSATPITSIEIGKHVSIVKSGAFLNAKNLSKVILHDDLILEERVFASTISLRQITLPSFMTSIPARLFSGSGIEEIIIPESVTSIGDYAFYNTKNLKEINFPHSLVSIGDYAFSQSAHIDSITVPENVSFIGYGAFSQMPKLTNVILPEDLTFIADYLFNESSNLEVVNLNNNITYIGSYAFTKTKLSEVLLNDNITYIGGYAFSQMPMLKNISLPKVIETISPGLFYGSVLEEIVIPESVLSIESYAFYNSKNLTNVVLPSNLTKIGISSFEGASSIKSLNLPNTLISIESRAFRNMKLLDNVVLGDNINRINDGLFSGASNLTNIVFSDSITYIGSQAFLGTSITNIVIPEGITTINDKVFQDAVKLQTVILPSTLEAINSSAFMGAQNLTTINFPASLKRIESLAFAGALLLEDVFIDSNVTYVGESAFLRINKNAIITANFKEKPTGWHASWNSSNVEVVWLKKDE